MLLYAIARSIFAVSRVPVDPEEPQAARARLAPTKNPEINIRRRSGVVACSELDVGAGL
jgi:hypothetical protein